MRESSYMCLWLTGTIELQSKDQRPGKTRILLARLSENPKWKMAGAVADAIEFYTHGINQSIGTCHGLCLDGQSHLLCPVLHF